MKQNANKNRLNGRYGHFNNRRPSGINKNTVLDSSGPCGRLRGTCQQISEKYLAASKDAKGQHDSILAETCLQYADHYARLNMAACANERPIPPVIEGAEEPVVAETVEAAEEAPAVAVEENQLPKDLPFMNAAPAVEEVVVEPKPRRAKKVIPEQEAERATA